MNETFQSIYRRYSCRAFTDEMPSDEDLMAIAQAALAAPSAMNRQPWRVIVVKDRALIADMQAEGTRALQAEADQTTWERIKSRGGKLFYDAPCMITVPVVNAAHTDCGILTQTIAVAAASLGIESLICGLAGAAFNGGKAEEFKRRLGFPEGFEHGMTVLLGYAANPGGQQHALDFSKISVIE